MKQKPLIVFDSGIGGMSIYRPLKQVLPKENIIYIADTANFPYGTKSALWLSSRFQELAREFNALDPQIVVVACNSATTNVISELRKELKCLVVGVEPVIKPLATFASALALMTTVSADSPTTKRLLQEYGSHVRVYSPPNLASAIEYNDIEQVKKSIHEIKKIVQKYHVEAIGLSCTHYPLVLSEFKRVMPDVIFIDPSEAVVKEVLRVLRSK